MNNEDIDVLEHHWYIHAVFDEAPFLGSRLIKLCFMEKSCTKVDHPHDLKCETADNNPELRLLFEDSGLTTTLPHVAVVSKYDCCCNDDYDVAEKEHLTSGIDTLNATITTVCIIRRLPRLFRHFL